MASTLNVSLEADDNLMNCSSSRVEALKTCSTQLKKNDHASNFSCKVLKVCSEKCTESPQNSLLMLCATISHQL